MATKKVDAAKGRANVNRLTEKMSEKELSNLGPRSMDKIAPNNKAFKSRAVRSGKDLSAIEDRKEQARKLKAEVGG